MILRELFQLVNEDSASVVAALKKDRAEMKSKMAANPSLTVTLKARLAQLDAKIAAVTQKDKLRQAGEKAAPIARKAHQDFEEKRAAMSSEDKKDRLGKAISTGRQENKEKREEAGGSSGQAAQWKAYVLASSKDGKKVTATDIAQHFGINPRTVNKRLESDAYKGVRASMGR